jgi:hypothetical protein
MGEYTALHWTSFGQLKEVNKISAPPLMTLPQSSFTDPALAGIPEWTRFENSNARAVFGFGLGFRDGNNERNENDEISCSYGMGIQFENNQCERDLCLIR